MNALRTILAVLLFAFAGISAAAPDLQPGREYLAVEPQAGARAATASGKIEVVEFFSYGCPHCNDFQPLIKQWEKQLGKDIVFRQVPVSFGRPAWARLARAYYGLDASGQLGALNDKLFHALHGERANFSSDEALVSWAAGKGGNGPKLADAMASFDANTRLQKGDQEAAAYKIQGVPALVVDGRYLVRNEAASGYADLLRLTEALVAKARTEKRKK